MNNSTYFKGKKPASNSKIKIYNESLSRGKKDIYIGKKEKANLVIPIEKKSTDMRLIGQKKKNTVIAAQLQVQKKCLILSRAK